MDVIDLEKIAYIVQRAGDLVMGSFRSTIKIFQKSDGSLVTEVDRACEQFLKEELSCLVPGAGFIGEETGIQPGHEYTWIIDPIDGTKNFERGLPYFCISVALVKDQVVIAAVTWAPFLGDLWCAQLHQGATLNGKKLMMQPRDWQKTGIVGVMAQNRLGKTDQIAAFKKNCSILTNSSIRFRLCGAVALDMAYAAAGMMDVVLFENVKIWDKAAGILLIQEAGGWITQWDGSAMQLGSRTLIAGNPEICRLIVPYFP